MRYFVLLGVIVLALFVSASFVSAGIFDRLFEKVGLSPKDVSVDVVGINPVVVSVYNETLVSIDPIQASIRSVQFVVNVADIDGVGDINLSSVRANFSKTGEGDRMNNSCSVISGQSTANSQNFSCTISMWYFDAPGIWDINVIANDIGNKTEIINGTQTVYYGELIAFDVSSGNIGFDPVVPGALNVSANNDPTSFNNTGNRNGNVFVTAKDLIGEDDQSKSIGAGNFSVGITTGVSEPECGVSSSSSLINATSVDVATLNRGNLSLGGGVAQRDIFYCIRQVPSDIPSQRYSTLIGGSWEVVFA